MSILMKDQGISPAVVVKSENLGIGACPAFGTIFAAPSFADAVVFGGKVDDLMLFELYPLAAAGWAFLVWIFGGGLGLALVVFVVLKMLGK